MNDEPHPGRSLWSRFSHGRRLGPLVGPWVTSLLFAGILLYVESVIPALHDVIGIIYWMLLALVLFTTLRWMRSRSGDRRARKDRRGTREADRPSDK